MTKTTIKVKGDVAQAEKSFRSLNSKIEDLSKTAKGVAKKSGVAFAALFAGIVLAGNEFGKFEKSMKGVKTLLDKTSFQNVGKDLDAGFKDLTKNTLKVFKDIPIELDAVTKSMFDLVSAGIPASEATKTLAVAGKLAVAGLTDVSIATDGLTSVMNAYGIEAENADKVAGKFFLAQKAGKTTIAELASGFGKVGATAQALGVSFEEVLSSVSAMTLGGVKTAEAYTSVNAVLSGIAKPTAEASEEAERLGIEFNQAALNSQGLSGFLQTLTQSAGFNKDSITKLFGSVEAMKAIFALTGTQADSFGKILSNLQDDVSATKTLTEAYNETLKSQDADIQLTKNAFKALSIEMGAKLSPLITGISKLIREMIGYFSGLSDTTKTVVTVIGLFVTALAGITAAVSTFLVVLPQLVAGFGILAAAVGKLNLAFLANPIVLAVAAIVTAITGLYIAWKNNFLGIQEIAFGVFGAIKTFFSEFIDNVSQMFGGLGDILIGVFTLDTERIKSGLASAMEAVSAQIDATAKAYQVAHDKRLAQIKKEGDAKVKSELTVAKATKTEMPLMGSGSAIMTSSKKGMSSKEKKAYLDRLKEQKKLNDEFAKKQQEEQVAMVNTGLGFGQNALQGRAGAANAVGKLGGMAADMLMPGIGGAVGGLVQTLSELGPDGAKQMISDFMESIPDLIVTAVEALIASADTIIEKFITVFLVEGGLERIFMALLRGIPRLAAAIVTSTISGLGNALGALSERFGLGTINSMSANFGKLLEPFRKFLDEYVKFYSELFSKISGFFSKIVERVTGFYRGYFEGIRNFFNGFIETMTDLFNWLPDAIRKAIGADGGGGGTLGGLGKAIGDTGKLGGFFEDLGKVKISTPKTGNDDVDEAIATVLNPASWAKGKAPRYMAKGWTPKWPDTELAWIDPRERIMSNADNKTVISGINSILSKVSGGQNINLSLTFRGDGIQELIQRSLVEASALGTGRIQLAVGSET